MTCCLLVLVLDTSGFPWYIFSFLLAIKKKDQAPEGLLPIPKRYQKSILHEPPTPGKKRHTGTMGLGISRGVNAHDQWSREGEVPWLSGTGRT